MESDASLTVAGWRERVAITLVLLGGLLGPWFWAVGAILLWRSKCWTRREKLVGTFVIPGGLVTSVVAFWFALNHGDHRGAAYAALAGAVVLVLFVAPFVTTVYLSMRLRLD